MQSNNYGVMYKVYILHAEECRQLDTSKIMKMSQQI
jgi:hypothetical protein